MLTNDSKNILDVWHKDDKEVDNEKQTEGNDDMTDPTEIFLGE